VKILGLKITYEIKVNYKRLCWASLIGEIDPTTNPNIIMAADPSFSKSYMNLNTFISAYNATLKIFSPVFYLIVLNSFETSLSFSIF
jgi:hypothetical protein